MQFNAQVARRSNKHHNQVSRGRTGQNRCTGLWEDQLQHRATSSSWVLSRAAADHPQIPGVSRDFSSTVDASRAIPPAGCGADPQALSGCPAPPPWKGFHASRPTLTLTRISLSMGQRCRLRANIAAEPWEARSWVRLLWPEQEQLDTLTVP
jgi:hypothetical protein